MYPDYKELVRTVPIVLYYHPVCYHNTGRSLKYIYDYNYATSGTFIRTLCCALLAAYVDHSAIEFHMFHMSRTKHLSFCLHQVFVIRFKYSALYKILVVVKIVVFAVSFTN